MEKNNMVIVEEPLHIPAIIYTLEELSHAKKEPVYTLLCHREKPCIVRGKNQALIGEFDTKKGYHIVRGIPEIKRQDGGNSWYHGATTCLVKVNSHYPPHTKGTQTRMNHWHNQLIEFYEDFTQNLLNPGGEIGYEGAKGERLIGFSGKADLYLLSEPLKQIIGTSGYNLVSRACWYEAGLNSQDSLENLVRNDPQVRDFSAFKNALGFSEPGFSAHIKSKLGITGLIGSSEFITQDSLEKALSLQKQGGNLIGPCIGGKYPERATRNELEKMREAARYV